MWALVFGVVALTAPYLAFSKTDVAIEDFTEHVAAAPPKGVSEGSNKKISMVTETLKDILQSVVNEEAQEKTIYDKYTKWCGTESEQLGKDISDTKTALENAKVLSEEQLSNVDSLTLFISKSEKEIEDTKDAIAQAIALRTEENDGYTQDMQINTQSLRQIETAIQHVGKVQKQGGFLQNGVVHKLQLNQPGESSYVLGIMKGLKEKLTKTRASLKSTEEEKVKMHNSFLSTKGESMKVMSDTTTAKKILLTETSAKQAGTKQKILKLTEESAKLLENQRKVDESCSTSKQEWKVRQADRTDEKAALGEAIRYLKELSFEQVSFIQQVPEQSIDEEHNTVVFSPSFLQTEDSSDASDTVSERAFEDAATAAFLGEDDKIAAHMQKDTFNGVKDVVSKLISTHADTQKEEKEKKEYCQTEIESKEDEKEDTTNTLAAVKANIEKKSSEVEMLADEVKKLYASIDKIKTSLETATKVRGEEKALFGASSKDRALATKVLHQAIEVLQSFYEKKKGSMLQQAGRSSKNALNDPPPEKVSAGSARKTSAGFGAVSMVQDIVDDIVKEQKDATMQENEAAETFTKLQQDSQQETDDKHQDITDRVTTKAKLGVQINTLKETQLQKNDDLVSIGKQLDGLHKQCDELVEFYDKRKKARTFEVAQLRDVMDILSGSSLSVRTGLMQMDEAAQQVSNSQTSAATDEAQ
jgi:hypothetical protein